MRLAGGADAMWERGWAGEWCNGGAVTIELVPLATVEVQFRDLIAVGVGPAGDRIIGELSAFDVSGERLTAHLRGVAAADWGLTSAAQVWSPDVRLAIETDDGATVFVTYQGRIDLSRGWDDADIYVAPRFETADERYRWLNTIQAVGKGHVTDGGLRYEWCELR
jgi:hypothetical protein